MFFFWLRLKARIVWTNVKSIGHNHSLDAAISREAFSRLANVREQLQVMTDRAIEAEKLQGQIMRVRVRSCEGRLTLGMGLNFDTDKRVVVRCSEEFCDLAQRDVHAANMLVTAVADDVVRKLFPHYGTARRIQDAVNADNQADPSHVHTRDDSSAV